ncbi:hypothetical protein C6I20_11195 [Aeromicrobium sp. A1-2]|uniref:hypothetical protein n=1 Tax=Aeromicrobium sp. A1-2 TaxID=2107713 RepID=UPI000E499E01|nr:hypothetical protein [Aeromicrobium sp. A1-2]AXT85698.1 hypothetical protein C6I20_11195 [Aeromicrobium sp. A1-2]
MRRTLPAAIAILLLAAGCGSGSPGPSAGPTSSPSGSVPSTPVATSAPAPTGSTAAAPGVVDYGDDEVTVSKPSDAGQLTGAPDDFAAFIRAELARQQASKDDVCTEKAEIHVARVDPRGWASGGLFIPQCGGNAALWAKVGGAWKEVWAGQTLPDCSILKKYRFPVAIAQGTCVQGGKEIPYTA